MILEISVAVIAFFVVIFVIGLLFVFIQLKRTAKEAEKLLETARQHIVPLSHDVTIVVNDTKRIVASIQKQMGMVEQGVGEVKDTVSRITEFEKKLHDKLEQPILDVATFASAISKAIKSFFGIWKRKQK
jgi:uncharacterized protein YoxC